MPRRRRPRDIREKEQQARAREKESIIQKFRDQSRICVSCGKHNLVFREHEQRMIIHCPNCLSSDSLAIREGWDEADYHAHFLDRFQKAANTHFIHCLVLKIHPKYFGSAVAFLESKYKKNIMSRLGAIDAENSLVWLIGRKKNLDAIREDFDERSFVDTVERDYPIAMHFLHYFNGVMYNLSRKEFKKMLALEAYKMLMGEPEVSESQPSPFLLNLFEKTKDPYTSLFEIETSGIERWYRRIISGRRSPVRTSSTKPSRSSSTYKKRLARKKHRKVGSKLDDRPAYFIAGKIMKTEERKKWDGEDARRGRKRRKAKAWTFVDKSERMKLPTVMKQHHSKRSRKKRKRRKKG